MNPLLVVNALVCEPSKKLDAAHCPVVVVCIDDLLEKKLGVDTDDAKDSEVEPLASMFVGKIVVHPQYPNLWRLNPYGGGGDGSAPSLGSSPGQYASLFCNLMAAGDRLYQGGGGSGDSLRDGHQELAMAMNATLRKDHHATQQST